MSRAGKPSGHEASPGCVIHTASETESGISGTHSYPLRHSPSSVSAVSQSELISFVEGLGKSSRTEPPQDSTSRVAPTAKVALIGDGPVC